MAQTVDMAELEAALDERDWRIVQSYEDRVADALQAVVSRGASQDEVRRVIRQRYHADDRLLARLEAAARHLRREREAAQ